MLKDMEKWISIRRRVLGKEISKRQACREYGIGWRTLEKVLAHEEPPGYRQRQPRRKPKLERFLPIIHGILEADRQAELLACGGEGPPAPARAGLAEWSGC